RELGDRACRADTCIEDQRLHRTERLAMRLHDAGGGFRIGEIGGDSAHLLGARFPQTLGDTLEAFRSAGADRQRVAAFGKAGCDTEADSPRGSGHERAGHACAPFSAASPAATRSGTASPARSKPSPMVAPARHRWLMPSAMTASLR